MNEEVIFLLETILECEKNIVKPYDSSDRLTDQDAYNNTIYTAKIEMCKEILKRFHNF